MSPVIVFGWGGYFNIVGGGRLASGGPRVQIRQNADGERMLRIEFANGERTAYDPNDPSDVKRVLDWAGEIGDEEQVKRLSPPEPDHPDKLRRAVEEDADAARSRHA